MYTILDFYFLLGLKELAKYPNVYCKVSGMFTADPSWSVQKFIETAVKPCLEIFGVNRYYTQVDYRAIQSNILCV